MSLKSIILAGMFAISCGPEVTQNFSTELSELKKIGEKISESNNATPAQEVCDLSGKLQQEVLKVFADHEWTKYPQGSGNYAGDFPDLSPVYIPAGNQFSDLNIQGLQCYRKKEGQEYKKSVFGCNLFPNMASDVIPDVSFEIGIPGKDYIGEIAVSYRENSFSDTESRTFSNLIGFDAAGELGTMILDSEKNRIRTWAGPCKNFDKKEFEQRIKDFETFVNSLY